MSLSAGDKPGPYEIVEPIRRQTLYESKLTGPFPYAGVYPNEMEMRCRAETERLTRLVCSAALSRAVCSIAELGVADHIETGAPQPVERLAENIVKRSGLP
jgi:hypothetical protein